MLIMGIGIEGLSSLQSKSNSHFVGVLWGRLYCQEKMVHYQRIRKLGVQDIYLPN